MPLIKYFLGELYKLRGFLTQIKITNKGLKLPIVIITDLVLSALRLLREDI